MSVHYVAAGSESYCDSSAQILVTREKNKKETTEFGPKFKQWRTYDKTISIVTRSKVSGAALKQTADIVVPISNALFVKACGLTKVLANPIHGGYVKSTFEDKGIESIIDSGGFQMLTGVLDFVDPNDVVKRYNRTANIGMPIDLPVRAAFETDFFNPVSKMMKANDDYLLERLDKGIHLALISHGTSIEKRKQRLDVLDRDAEVVAFAGGFNIKPPPGVDRYLNSLENLMYVIHRYRKTARYFHVLGVTSKFWMFIYSLIDALGYVKEIGADSVSHRMGSLIGMVDRPDFEVTSIQKNQVFKQVIPCGCPVCVAIDDIRILNSSAILEAHNLWVRAKQTEMLVDLAKHFLRGDVTLQEIYRVMNLRIDLTKFQYMVNYVREIVASDKFRPIKLLRSTKNLFSDIIPEDVAEEATVGKDKYNDILSKYEKFHKRKFR
jgi:hypothetical protein